MDVLLAEKLALVTGSTAGIGFAIAEGLAREKATVIVNGRTKPRVTDAVAAIRQNILSPRLKGLPAISQRLKRSSC
jgi:NAD(P)-dependent dehydrogenase (short-subunit alcohol dehydrogenase family)